MTIDASLIIPQTIPMPNAPQIPNPIPLKVGMYYLFQRAGVILPEHSHNDNNTHFTIIIAGSFEVTEGFAEPEIRIAGDIIDLGTEPHSFKALEDNSVLINITKLGVSATDTILTLDVINPHIDALISKLNQLKGN